MRFSWKVSLLLLANVGNILASPAIPPKTNTLVLPASAASTTKISSASPSPTVFWPTAVLPKLPPKFKIPSEALSCWNSWANYQLRSELPNPGIIATETTSYWRSPLPNPTTIIEDLSYCTADAEQVLVGLTTLCDGVARASYRSEKSGTWYLQTWIVTNINSDTWASTVIPGTTLPGYENPEPDCQVAPNTSPLCDTINSAYTWWLSQASKTPAPTSTTTTTTLPGTSTASIIETLAAPSCIQFVPVPPNAKPTCALELDNIEVWYWPGPGPTGSQFCNTSWTAPTGTPTVSGKPNTAVVSGLTLTSPSLYYLLKSATVYTLAGTQRKADNGAIRSTFVYSASSSTLASIRPLTVKQLETEVLSATFIGPKHPHGAINIEYNPNFRTRDIFTMRSGPYFQSGSGHENYPYLIQAEVDHVVAVPAATVARQNKVWTECVWTETASRVVYASTYPVAVEMFVSAESFKPVVTKVPLESGGTWTLTERPVATTSSVEATRPRPPACTAV